jgi:hypothetical protein
MDFLSHESLNLNSNISLPSPEIEAKRIFNILGLTDENKLGQLEIIFHDYDLEIQQKQLLLYLRKKYSRYYDELRSNSMLSFYQEKNIDCK